MKSNIIVTDGEGQIDLIDDNSKETPFHFGLLCFGEFRTKLRPLKRKYTSAITALEAADRVGWRVL